MEITHECIEHKEYRLYPETRENLKHGFVTVNVFHLNGDVEVYIFSDLESYGITAIGYLIPTDEGEVIIHPAQVKKIEVCDEPIKLPKG